MTDTPDPYILLLAHNRRALTLLLAAARNLSKSDLHREFGLGVGTFHDAIISCLACMAYWGDQIDCGSPRQWLVVTDAEGRVLASETRSVHAMQTMLQGTADQLDDVIARARPFFAEEREWTLNSGDKYRVTVAEAVLHMINATAEGRDRALLALHSLDINPLPSTDFISSIRAHSGSSPNIAKSTEVSS